MACHSSERWMLQIYIQVIYDSFMERGKNIYSEIGKVDTEVAALRVTELNVEFSGCWILFWVIWCR